MKSNFMRSFLRQSLIAAIIGCSLSSCAPVFSELQSARTVGQGQAEVIPSYSTVSFSDEGESERVQNHLGLQAAYGLSDRLDLRLRYEYIWMAGVDEDDTFSASVIGIGPKYNLIENMLSVYLPIGTAFGEDMDENNWQMHPTLLLTWPAIEDILDVTLAPKYLLTFCEGCDDFIALNLGLSFGELGRWSVRPEYGMLFNSGEEGHFGQFSIGVAYNFGALR